MIAQTIKPLKIGDRLPETFWIAKRIIVEGEQAQESSFQQYKGKAMLLDFWATWCGACLNDFPKMNQLQTKLTKQLKVLLININAKDSPNALLQMIKKQEAPFDLAMVANDLPTNNMFPVSSIPHYIWVGSDGRIKAITGADAVTINQLKRLIAGLELNLKSKVN